MFEIIDNLPYHAATDVVHYAIKKLKMPNSLYLQGNKIGISSHNKMIADSLIIEINLNPKGVNGCIEELYEILKLKAEKENLYKRDRGLVLLEELKAKQNAQLLMGRRSDTHGKIQHRHVRGLGCGIPIRGVKIKRRKPNRQKRRIDQFII